MNNHRIYIIIPVFNENSGVVKNLLEELLLAGYSVIVIDDGSENDLLPAIKGLPVHYIRHAVNMGQGAAIQTGLDYARKLNAEIAVTFDADGQHRVADIQALIEPLTHPGIDVTLGSRFIAGSRDTIPFSRRMILQLARFVNFLFTGNLLSDAHNGLRAFNKKAIASINLQENRMAHASEILFEIREHGLVYREVPVSIHYSSYAMKKGQSGWNSIKILFDLVLHKFFK
ncbi:MAG TPA: glycosyltransferase family 2 protein [Flavisolibacter sp.]